MVGAVDESRGFGEALPASDLFTKETFGTRMSRQGSVLWLALGGELDVFTAPQLRAALREARPGPGETLVLDLRGLSFIDSSGLAVILGAHEDLGKDEGEPLRIVIKGSATVEALFELIGASGYLNVIESAEELDTT